MNTQSVRKFSLAAFTLLFFPLLSFAQVEGEYASDYKGIRRVRVTKSGDVYHVRWDLNDGSHWVGVGLLNKTGDVFTVASVVSRGSDIEYANGSLHISVYAIERDAGRIKRLVSEAARYGDRITHFETWAPRR